MSKFSETVMGIDEFEEMKERDKQNKQNKKRKRSIDTNLRTPKRFTSKIVKSPWWHSLSPLDSKVDNVFVPSPTTPRTDLNVSIMNSPVKIELPCSTSSNTPTINNNNEINNENSYHTRSKNKNNNNNKQNDTFLPTSYKSPPSFKTQLNNSHFSDSNMTNVNKNGIKKLPGARKLFEFVKAHARRISKHISSSSSSSAAILPEERYISSNNINPIPSEKNAVLTMSQNQNTNSTKKSMNIDVPHNISFNNLNFLNSSDLPEPINIKEDIQYLPHLLYQKSIQIIKKNDKKIFNSNSKDSSTKRPLAQSHQFLSSSILAAQVILNRNSEFIQSTSRNTYFPPSPKTNYDDIKIKKKITDKIESTTTDDNQEDDDDKRCHCKRSKCLKLYCECFARGATCNGCFCVGCQNLDIPSFQLIRKRAIINTLDRDSTAFNPKILTEKGTHTKGCNCKKSHCTKKYCECFQANVYCTSSCKCQDCHNVTKLNNEKEELKDEKFDCNINIEVFESQKSPKKRDSTEAAAQLLALSGGVSDS